MGPHFFKCGKSLTRRAESSKVEELQWGRTFSSAERIRQVVVAGDRALGFNGAALFQVRKETPNKGDVVAYTGLQWGRTFSSAESHSLYDEDFRKCEASMGPHFFKCGKTAMAASIEAAAMASMGPHFFKCGK